MTLYVHRGFRNPKGVVIAVDEAGMSTPPDELKAEGKLLAEFLTTNIAGGVFDAMMEELHKRGKIGGSPYYVEKKERHSK